MEGLGAGSEFEKLTVGPSSPNDLQFAYMLAGIPQSQSGLEKVVLSGKHGLDTDPSTTYFPSGKLKLLLLPDFSSGTLKYNLWGG
jgi:hypothetical protein